MQRLWSAHEPKPHRLRDFKLLSKDLQFEKKFWDVVGLYLNPPDQALVLCSDEKSQAAWIAFGPGTHPHPDP